MDEETPNAWGRGKSSGGEIMKHIDYVIIDKKFRNAVLEFEK